MVSVRYTCLNNNSLVRAGQQNEQWKSPNATSGPRAHDYLLFIHFL